MRRYDFLIVGSGIVGLVLALKLKAKFANKEILMLDKEADSVQHGTGRNSGVIHSGIYYPQNTLRAKYCISGSKQLKNYVKENNLWIDECGKILLPSSKKSMLNIDVLLERAADNGIVAERIDKKRMLELEPNANPFFEEGIHVPFTSIVDPKEVALSIVSDVKKKGVEIIYNSEVTDIDSSQGKVSTNESSYLADVIINSAGLQAERIAKISSLKSEYSFLPFKGKYWELNSGIKLSKLLYPVPDLSLPFLGIHTVHNKDGKIYIGPSSTPVFGRENYSGSKNIKIKEALFLMFSFALKIIFNVNGLRSLALRELKLISLSGVYKEARNLLTGIKRSQLCLSEKKVGIRSQIFDKDNKSLVSDFVVKKDKRIIHILNAISPAFTASFGLADFIIENVLEDK